MRVTNSESIKIISHTIEDLLLVDFYKLSTLMFNREI